MSLPSIGLLSSLAELEAQQARWNALWERSRGASPLARAEHVALWVRQFSSEAAFRAVVIEDGGQLVAALPMVSRRWAGRWGWGALPLNEWSSGGSLLVDASAGALVFDRLVTGLRLTRWSLWSFSEVDLSLDAWSTFVAALERAGFACEYREQFTSGRVRVAGNWPDYLASRTKKHRHNLRRNLARLGSLAPSSFQFVFDAPPSDIPALLERGFEVEHRSWKGSVGSSVRQAEGMFDFHVRQAQTLAASGHLRLGYLEHQGQAIAFDYGFVGGNVYYRSKIGYDERFSAFSPGQLLAAAMFERLHEEQAVEWIDFMGPLSDALAKWATETYVAGRLLFAAPGMVGRTLFEAYRAAHRWKVHRRAVSAQYEQPAEATGTRGENGATQPAEAEAELVEA